MRIWREILLRNVSILHSKKLRHNEIRHVHIIFANHIYIYKHMIYDRDLAGSASFFLVCEGAGGTSMIVVLSIRSFQHESASLRLIFPNHCRSDFFLLAEFVRDFAFLCPFLSSALKSVFHILIHQENRSHFTIYNIPNGI